MSPPSSFPLLLILYILPKLWRNAMAPLKRLLVVHTCSFSVSKNKLFRTTFFSGLFFRCILYGCFPVAPGYTITAFLGLGVLPLRRILPLCLSLRDPCRSRSPPLSLLLCPYSAVLSRTLRAALLCRSLPLSALLAARCRSLPLAAVLFCSLAALPHNVFRWTLSAVR